MPLIEDSHGDRPHSRPAEEMTEEERARAWWSVADDEKSSLRPPEAGSNAPAPAVTGSPS